MEMGGAAHGRASTVSAKFRDRGLVSQVVRYSVIAFWWARPFEMGLSGSVRSGPTCFSRRHAGHPARAVVARRAVRRHRHDAGAAAPRRSAWTACRLAARSESSATLSGCRLSGSRADRPASASPETPEGTLGKDPDRTPCLVVRSWVTPRSSSRSETAKGEPTVMVSESGPSAPGSRAGTAPTLHYHALSITDHELSRVPRRGVLPYGRCERSPCSRPVEAACL